MMQAIRPELSSASRVAPDFPVPAPEPKLNKHAGKASSRHAVRADTTSNAVSEHKWACLYGCGFQHSSWNKVEKHEAHCPAATATGPWPLLLQAKHNDDSGFETAPESAASCGVHHAP